MALSSEAVEKHIAYWEHQLSVSRYPWTSKWPSRIFRHDPLENIAQILISGRLLSRNGSHELRAIDIAAKKVINSTREPHQYVRMYFRPRTPTQYYVEGIRREDEYYQTDTSPLIGVMIFQSRELLTRPDVKFSDKNMAISTVLTGTDEEFFTQNIPFSSVYHHGWQGANPDIRQYRCAEVLLPSPLEINSSLKHIYCRTVAERETLLNMLPTETLTLWRDKVLVSNDMKLFEKEYCFIEDVRISNDGVLVQLSPRKDNQKVKINVKIKIHDSNLVVYEYSSEEFSPRPPNGTLSWIFKFDVQITKYKVTIKLENCLAYESILEFNELPF